MMFLEDKVLRKFLGNGVGCDEQIRVIPREVARELVE
jgi:hypothetical protein